MAFIVGIDGGGTKTAVTITHDQEDSLFTFTVGPINYNGGDADAIAASFEKFLVKRGSTAVIYKKLLIYV